MPLAQPAVTYSEDLYRFHWPSIGVECLVENLVDRKEDISAELTVNVAHTLGGGRLYSGRLLLLGPNSRRDIRRELALRIAEDEINWGGILEQLCNMSRERFRRGAPMVDLAEVVLGERPRYLVKPFVIDRAVSIIYGDGATAKSTIALAMTLAIATGDTVMGLQAARLGPCLYLDWEDDEDLHAERLQALCAGLGIDVPEGMIFYQRRSAKLPDSVRETRRLIAEKGIVFAVVDSLGMAAGDPLDTALTIETLRACRSFEIPVLGVHHLPKDAKDKTKPFGTVYASNEARLTWLVEKAQEEDSDELSLLLTNYKNNRGRREPRQAYKVRFENDAETDRVDVISIQSGDITKMEEFVDKLTTHQRLVVQLRGPARNVKELADRLADEAAASDGGLKKVTEAVIRTTLNRGRKRGLFYHSGSDDRWTLTATAEAVQQPRPCNRRYNVI